MHSLVIHLLWCVFVESTLVAVEMCCQVLHLFLRYGQVPDLQRFTSEMTLTKLGCC